MVDFVSRVLLAAQYTGENGSEVLDAVKQVTQYTANEWSVLSDDTETLVLREAQATGLYADWPVQRNQWVIVAPDFGIVARISPESFAMRYRSINSIIDGGIKKAKEDDAFIAAVAQKVKEKG